MNLPDVYRGSDVALRQGPGLPADFAPDRANDRLDFRSLWWLLRRRTGLIVLVMTLCALAALVITLRSPKLYTANADVVLRTEVEAITPEATPAGEDQPRRAEDIETELQYLRSRQLAGKLFDTLGLANDAGFTAQYDNTAPDRRERAISVIGRQFEARRISTAYALRLSYSDPDPVRAARIANGFAKLYVDSQVETKVTENRTAIGILQSRMEELRRQAQTDFRALQEYRIRNNLQTKSGTALTEQEISAYSQQVALARAQAAQDSARVDAARGQLRGTGVGDGGGSGALNALRGQRAAISVKVAELSERYLDSHPELTGARQQLADIDSQIRAESDRSIGTLEAIASASGQRLASLSASLGGATGRLESNNSALVQMDDLERRAQASQALYESYLNRYKEAVARSGAEQPNADLLSGANPPKRASSPNLPLNLSLGLLVGTLLGVAAAIGTEGAYSGLTTGDDVERRLRVRYLGSVPLLKSVESHANGPLETVAQHAGGAFAESIRGILAALRQNAARRHQIVAITSALPREGKTMIAACLGEIAAQSHERVAIIDCDTVRAALSELYAPGHDGPGLRELLHGEAAIEQAVIQRPDGPAVFAITRAFDKGERLLEQGRLQRLVAQLRERYDLIILDCAPLLPIAETREIVALADAVLITIHWRHTSDGAVRAALKMIPAHKTGALGTVLNLVDMRKRARFGEGDPGGFFNRYKNYYSR